MVAKSTKLDELFFSQENLGHIAAIALSMLYVVHPEMGVDKKVLSTILLSTPYIPSKSCVHSCSAKGEEV